MLYKNPYNGLDAATPESPHGYGPSVRRLWVQAKNIGFADQQAMYFFKVSPSDSFGICHYYNEEDEEESFTVRDNSLHMMPRGHHTVVSAPGYTTYYLWFLVGSQRTQAAVDDPSWAG